MQNATLIKNIGQNIRYERLKRDLTIEELSEIINIAPGFLGLIERGQRGTSLSNLIKISKFFKISLDDLIIKDISNISKVEESKDSKSKELLDDYLRILAEDDLEFFIDVVKSFVKLRSK